MPSLASMDIGSNTLRLLIGKIEENRIIDVYSDRKITRLGEGVDYNGMLQENNMEASIAAITEFSSLISKYGVKQVKAIATSALREASNSDIFIKKVFDRTGIAIEVISGQKEAELTLKGILFTFSDSKLPSYTNYLIVDIGGGSTEWILYRAGLPVIMESVPVGVIKLCQRFFRSDPLSQTDLGAMSNEILSVLTNLRPGIGHQIDRKTLLIGTAGTFTTIASIDLGLEYYSREKVHLHTISLERLHEMSKKLLLLTLEERKKVKGLEPERADLIIPGLLFTIKVMEIFQFAELTISDYGLLEGALLEIKEGDGKSISETTEP